MDIFQAHILSAGPVVYPLLFCSVAALTLILERLLVLLCYPWMHSDRRRAQFLKNTLPAARTDNGLLAGLQLLHAHRAEEKPLRDELLGVWLHKQRTRLLAHTRWLTLLGSLAPLLGLLGTVLGIIAMFQDVAHVAGPVTPALLADGMWEAMVTTALGMLIAIPALAASQGFTIWSDFRVARMTQVLNECSLALELECEPKAVTVPDKVIKPTVFHAAVGASEAMPLSGSLA